MSSWSPADLLPALELVALAGGATFILHRFYDRLPAPVVLTFTAVLAVALGPFLAGGELLLPLDSLRAYVPFTHLAPTEPHGNPLQGDLIQLVAPASAEVGRAVAEGRWPLWSQRMGAGLPLLADPQAQVFQPLAWAALPLGPARGAAVTAGLQVYCALLFTFLLLRRQGLATGPSLGGALAWGLGGFLSLWMVWPLASTAAWLPAVLYGIRRLLDRGGRRDVLLLALALAGLLGAGHPETILYAVAVAAAFFAGGLFTDRGRRRRPDEDEGAARRRVAAAAGAALLALTGTAPAMLATAAYLPQTLRAARLAEPPPPPTVAAAGERAARRLVPLAAPNTFGNDRYAAYWGDSNFNEDASGFVGTPALLLALLAFGSLARRRGSLPGEGLMAAVVALSLVVVAQPPGVVDLMARLPGGAVSGYYHRLLLPLGFALAYLAACELERRRRGEGRAWEVAAVAVLLAGVIVGAYLAFPHPEEPERLDVLRRGWVHWHLRFLAAAALLLALGRGRRLLPWGVAALVAAELLLLHRPAHPPAPKRLAFPASPVLERIAAGLETPAGYRFAGLEGTLPPNLGALYGLADTRLYSPVAPAAYVAATAPVRVGWEGEVPEMGRPERPLYDLLAVRYLLAPPGRQPPPGLRVVLRDPGGQVWERPAPLPRLFLPRSAEAQAADWPQRLAEITDFAGRALVADGPAAGAIWQAGRPEAGRLTPLTLGSARIGARFEAPEPRLLASSVYQDGGWRLLLDGRRRPTTRADGPFLAAWLPAGRHRLELVYRPPGFLPGCLAAALGLALGTAWLVPPPGRRPRLPPATPGGGDAAAGA